LEYPDTKKSSGIVMRSGSLNGAQSVVYCLNETINKLLYCKQRPNVSRVRDLGSCFLFPDFCEMTICRDGWRVNGTLRRINGNHSAFVGLSNARGEAVSSHCQPAHQRRTSRCATAFGTSATLENAP